MGLFDWMKKQNKRSAGKSSFSNPEQWLVDLMGGALTNSGARINEMNACKNITVLACIGLLSDSIASLPCVLFEETPDGKRMSKKPAVKHPAYKLLKKSPNPEMTPFTFQELMIQHLSTWGNSYNYIARDGAGNPRELWPCLPDRTNVRRNPANGELMYETIDRFGNMMRIAAEDMLHIPGMGFDGLVGKSPIGLMREAIGLSVSGEEYGARFFSNGANSGGVLEHPNQLSDAAYARLKESFNERYSGNSNAHKTQILEEGMKFNKITIPPNDAQFLETRGFQVEEIARGFRVPPPLIGYMEKASSFGTGIEQLSIGFVKYTLRPIAVRVQDTFNKKLLTESEQKNMFFKYNMDALLGGDFKTRMEGYNQGRVGGWLSINDIREKEDMDPVESGDDYLQPLNMAPAGSIPPAKDIPKTGGNK